MGLTLPMAHRTRTAGLSLAAVARRFGLAVTYPVRTPLAWWAALEPAERILYRAVGLLGLGCGLAWPPLALIVPGLMFALIFFGFDLHRRT